MKSVEIQDMVVKYVMWYDISWDQDIESGYSLPVFTIEFIEYANRNGMFMIPIDKLRDDIMNHLSSEMMD